MQNQLKEIALLGTTKKSLDTTVLPKNIKQIIDKMGFDDPEHQLLNTLSIASFYADAGTGYPILDEVPELPIITDTQQYAPKQAQEIFSLLDTISPFMRPLLLTQWLAILVKNNWLVVPEHCIGLLQFANPYTAKVKDDVLQVIGNKGRSVIPFDASLKYTVNTTVDTDVWEYGTTKQRTTFIKKLRKQDAAKALELLQNSWKSETVVGKRNWLQIIKESYSAEIDFNFVSELYQTEFLFNEKERKTNVECRHILAQILLGDEKSDLYKSTISELKKVLVSEKKKGFLGIGGSSKINFELPTEDSGNAFWNAENFSQIYGFDAGYDIAVFKNSSLYYFSLFLTYVPSAFWLSNFNSSADEFINFFLSNDDFKVKRAKNNLPIFTDALVFNTIVFKDETLAASLANTLNVKDALKIFPLFSQDAYEKFVVKNKLLGDVEVLEYHPKSKADWSVKFSESVIKECTQRIGKYYYNQFNTCAMVLAKKAPLEIIKVLDKEREKVSENNNYNSWNAHFYEPLSSYLKIKNTLKNITA